MNHLTLLAAFKLCVLTHGRKSGLFEIRADHVTCLARDLFHSPPDPCAQRHLEPEIWKRKVLDWSQQRENRHLLGQKHAW